MSVYDPGCPSQPNDSRMLAAAVAVQRRVFPSLKTSEWLGQFQVWTIWDSLHVQRVQARFSNHCEDIVFFQKELSAGIKTNAMISEPRLNLLGFFGDKRHCFVPRCPLQLTVSPYEWPFEPVWVSNWSPSGFTCQTEVLYSGYVVVVYPFNPFGPNRPLLTRSVVRPLTPTIFPSFTPMSIPHPLLCWQIAFSVLQLTGKQSCKYLHKTQALCTHLSGVSTVCTSHLVGHSCW